jgi:predicted metalloprotease with PDZ domain
MTLGSIPLRIRPEAARILLLSSIFWVATASVAAQQGTTRIKLGLSGADVVRIDLYLQEPVKRWSFLNNYGAVMNLGSRIHDVKARGINGQPVSVRNIAPGEFRSEEEIAEFSYNVRLTNPRAGDVAHVSWLTPESGLLMFADLLPRDLTASQSIAEFRLPDMWGVQTAQAENEKHQFVVGDPVKAVFLVGKSQRKVSRTIEGMEIDFVFTGNWPFKEDKVAKGGSKLLKKYLALTDFRLPRKSVVIIAPMPVANSALKWTAETRGSTVIVLLDPRAPFRNWVAQLEVIFAHELFHLWVPNSLRLEGDYDWFFEGFTLYQALLTARELELISFQEYLNTLSRVYDSYRSSADHLSLIEASEQRWSGSGSTVYDKGMLVAFLYDLMLREESGGKSGVAEKYRELFRQYTVNAANGNEAIISLLTTSSATAEFLKLYVENKKSLELEQSLTRYGFSTVSNGTQTHLRVADNPSEAQSRLLRTLGYKR